ncbi:hypothetical protein FS749_007977 [Ceratobasidium sp. UAMH 11750]|nr:hypothetical protein FS749_007977 [Ceratobasidium sp. UAMH 11750]
MRHSGLDGPMLATHDIIVMICDNLEGREIINLLTVSHDFFHCVVRHIWRRLPDARPLLDLIPPRHCDVKRSTQSTDIQADNLRLSRFDFYARFVKELRLQPSLLGRKSNWHSLSNAVSRRPLLPNLCQLILDLPGNYISWRYCFKSPEDLTCIGAFLCPSLVDIRLPSGLHLWLGPNTASQLLESIADTAPELKLLHIYVESDANNIDAVPRTIIRLQSLRVLKCTSIMVDCEKLQLLGTLPQLESLQIVSSPNDYLSDDEDEIPLDDWVLPSQTFPMLRHLAAHNLPASMIVQLWRLTPLSRALVSISVRFLADSRLDGLFLDEIICGICKSSPQAQELSIDLGELDEGEVSAEVVGHIQELPLQRLRIVGSYTDELVHLIPFMANLVYLDVDSMALTFGDLVLIAECIPKLRFLSSNIILNQWPELSHPCSVIPSPSMLCLVTEFTFSQDFEEGDFESGRTMEDYLGAMSRLLFMLWPQGVRCEMARYEHVRASRADENNLRLLNNKILALSWSERLELPSSKSCRSDWMYEF